MGQASVVSRSPEYAGWAIGCIAFDMLTCEGLQVGLSGVDTRDLTFRGRVFFVGLDCGEVVIVGGWLSEDCLELRSSFCNVGYICDGFPDEVG